MIPIAGLALIALLILINRSTYVTLEGRYVEQPVPFSHEHHVGGLGIDCRYCHYTVEKSSFAHIPGPDTCMHCHSQIWNDAEVLKPVREAAQTGQPLIWKRVYDLPDFVYFNHRIHVQKGVACVTCHGAIDRMPLTARAQPLHMQWCLDCHQNPGPHIRPKEAVTDVDWKPGPQHEQFIPQLIKKYNIQAPTHCTACHR